MPRGILNWRRICRFFKDDHDFRTFCTTVGVRSKPPPTRNSISMTDCRHQYLGASTLASAHIIFTMTGRRLGGYESLTFPEIIIFMLQSETGFVRRGSTSMLTRRTGRLGIVDPKDKQNAWSPTYHAFAFLLCSLISTTAYKCWQWLQPHLCLNRCTSIMFSVIRWDCWWQSQHSLSKHSKGSENSGFKVIVELAELCTQCQRYSAAMSEHLRLTSVSKLL